MTIKDIARESGYAVGTVSRVLNNQPGVSEEAHKRVMEVVEKYIHNKFIEWNIRFIGLADNADTNVEGMGYAIPITDARDVIEGLINQEERKAVPESQRGALGIYGMNITSDVMSWYNVPQGVCIQGLVRDGAAEKAQIPVGSIITKIAGKDIDNLEELNEELQYHKKGETIKVTCYVMNGMQYVEQQYEVTLK